jgi:hypothetical protein
MEAGQEYTLPDLIYLFVDGETDSVQEEMLFKAMATKPELQKELQDAIRIRSTLEMDCSALSVPPDTTTALFQKAGFSVPGAASTGTAIGTNIATKGAIAWKSAGTAVMSVLKTTLLPALFVLGGAGLATMYFKLQPSNQNAVNQIIQNGMNNAAMQYSLQNSVSAAAQSSLQNSMQNQGSATSPAFATTEQPASPANRNEYRGTTRSEFNFNKNLPPDANGYAVDNKEYAGSFVNSTVQPENQVIQSDDNAYTVQSSSKILSGIGVAPAINSNNEWVMQRGAQGGFNPGRPVAAAALSAMQNDQRADLRISLRALSSFSGMNGFANPGDPQDLSNLAASLGYGIDNQNSIGLEFGRQSMRYFTFENGRNEAATVQNSLDWAGAFYRHHFNSIFNDEFTPYAQITLAGTASGPSGRLMTGLRWQPDSRIALSAGLEAATFLYKNMGTWYGANILGLSYQVEVRF